MSENNAVNLENKELSPEQTGAVGGGDGACDVVAILQGGGQQAINIYEAAVDFTSHVIERLLTAGK